MPKGAADGDDDQIYCDAEVARRKLGLKRVDEVYTLARAGYLAGVERWGSPGVGPKGRRKHGRLRFRRAELRYIGPRVDDARPSAPDGLRPAAWGRLRPPAE